MAALSLSTALGACGRRADVGAVVVSAIGAEPRLPDGSRDALAPADRLLTDALAQGLVRFDAAGQIEGGIAQRWIVTENGMSYIFRLRNARWADGSPVRAAQVVAQLRRQVGPRSGNPLRPYLSAIDAVVEMTPEVIEIDLSRPRPDLLKLFAQPEMALLRGRTPAGTGPFRLAPAESAALRLSPAPDPDRDPEEVGPTPEDDVRLIGERAARAVVRFVDRGSDLVTGGTLSDWPIMQAARPAPVNIRLDPAAGLFGLAVVRREGFLADVANRAAVAQAFDRAALVAAVSSEWPVRETTLPEQLDSAAPPAPPVWAMLPPDQRAAAARGRVALWARVNGTPTVRLALPAGPGGTLLWAHLARDLFAIGIRPVRVAADAPDADLRLLDLVAPYDSARWYLAEACRACSPEASAAIEAARVADTLTARGQAIAAADQALTADIAFMPLSRPLRWSLVSLRLAQWQPNARAWHPLNRLRRVTN